MENLIKSNKDLKILMEYAPICLSDAGVDTKKMLDFIDSFGFKIYECHKNDKPTLISKDYLFNNVGHGTTKPHINIILDRA
jgi:hypothetical protein